MIRLLVPATLASFGLLLLYRVRRQRAAKVLDIPRLPATASPEDVARAIMARGVVVIERLIPEALMDFMVEELASAQGKFHGAVGSFAGHHTLRNACKPLGESTVAQELALQPLVLAAVERLLKPWCKRVILGTCSAISVEAPPDGESPAPAQVLHRDGNMWGASGWPWPSSSRPRPELSISVMWAASDFTAQNGATRFLPGSNHWPPSLNGYGSKKGPGLPAGINPEDALQAVMPKGSVALWSGHTLHGAGSYGRSVRPEAPRPRHGLLFIYNLGWLRSEHNFHWAVPRTVLQSFSPSLQSLIGLDGENASEHSWYTGPVYAQPYLGGPEGSASGDAIQLKTAT